MSHLWIQRDGCQRQCRCSSDITLYSHLRRHAGHACTPARHFTGRLKTRERKLRVHKNEGVEIAGSRNEYGKPKFPFSNIVVESSIGLVWSSRLQQPVYPGYKKTCKLTRGIGGWALPATSDVTRCSRIFWPKEGSSQPPLLAATLKYDSKCTKTDNFKAEIS